MDNFDYLSQDQLEALKSEKAQRLFHLEKQRARFGDNTPPHVLMEIEDIKEELNKLSTQLSGIVSNIEHPVDAISFLERLAQFIIQYYSAIDFHSLCFYLGINVASLGTPNALQQQIHLLLKLLIQQQRLNELITYLYRMHPAHFVQDGLLLEPKAWQRVLDTLCADIQSSRIDRNVDSAQLIDLFTHKPFHTGPLVLLTTTSVEARTVLKVFEETLGQVSVTRRGRSNIYYYLGEINNVQIMMVRCEMGAGGPGGSTLTVAEAIQDLKPSAMLAVGIAFGMRPDKQNIGDVLVSRQILSYDLQRIGTSNGDETKIVSRGDRPSASVRLLSCFHSGELIWTEKAAIHFGLLLSGAKLVDNLQFRQQLQILEPESIGGEMEGTGLYDAAQRNHVDWLVVKAICDWADGQKALNKNKYQKLAAQNAIRFVLLVLQKIGLG